MLQRTALFKDFFILTLFIGLLFGINLGSRPLSTPDEGRYAEIPREMTVTGDYITPRLNGLKYFEKPPLMYWLGSISIKAFGLNEWGLRIWPALFSLIGCLAVYATARNLYGRLSGLLAAGALATSLYYYAHSRILILDAAVSIFISLSLLSFLAACLRPSRREKNIYLAGFFVCSALATLSKGLIGAVLPGCVILIWCLILRNWQALKMAFTPWGIILFFLIVSPWHVLVSLKNPEFPYFYFIHEHFLRYTTSAHGRGKVIGFFLPILFLGWFPWAPFLIRTLYDALKKFRSSVLQETASFFLYVWITFIFLFFSLSRSQLIPYILPLFPPLAILLGRYLASLWQAQEKRKANQDFIYLLILNGSVALGVIIALYLYPHLLNEMVEFYTGIILTILVLGGGLTYIVFRLKGPRFGLVCNMLMSISLLLSLNKAWPFLEERSIKPLALKIKESLEPGDKVLSYGRYYQDLPFYLNQRVMIANWKGELEFGMSQEDVSAWIILFDDLRVSKLWHGDKKVYMVTRKEFYRQLKEKGIKNLYPLLESKDDILLVNKYLGKK
jgi:4-amino-4-deoxy-L-arabinose transferase-like glycosyltransferase